MALASTTCCRAFALLLCLLPSVRAVYGASHDNAAERPLLPLEQKWSMNLSGKVADPPLSDGTRIFIAYASRELVAISVVDHRELWRTPDDVSCPFALDGGLLFDCSANALEARRTTDGSVAWTLPNVQLAKDPRNVVPLVAEQGWLLAVTDTEIIAINDASGTIVWRQPAGGVRLAPAIDGDRVYLGANDGKLVALKLVTGVQIWQRFVPEGITAIAGSHNRAYAGGGDKKFYCYNGDSGDLISGWPWRIGAQIVGHVAIDEDHVYVGSLDNVVRGLDRGNGNQRWDHLLTERPWDGVFAIGHIVFVPSPSATLQMLYAKDGHTSGNLTLPGDIPLELPPAIQMTAAGLGVFVVTSGLSNTWVLTMFGPAAAVPLESLTQVPGLLYLTDPELQTPAKGLWWLVAADPVLQPLANMGWPVMLRDPPLVPLSALPGFQLRPLSPTLPIRREPSGPGG